MAFEDEQDEYVRSVAARLVAGEERALEEIYDRWSALVHTYALRALGDPHDAEEATQQAFISAWRSRHTLTPSPSALPPGCWHRPPQGFRHPCRPARDAAKVAAATTLPEVRQVESEPADRAIADRLVVRQAVQDLPRPARTILFLAFWEEHSHAEIAERTGLPLGTVKSHVRRGLVQIHQQLEGVRRATG